MVEASEPDASPGAAVVARAVTKRFPEGLQAIGRLDLDAAPGEFIALVGPSGCGKSTFLRLVAGLAEPSDGELAVDGLSPRVSRARQRNLAYVLQDPTLLKWRRVAANVALPLQLRHWPGPRVEERVGAALDLVGLHDMAHLFPQQLSGGMRMRVSIARALAADPTLLLLDEPFGALDEITRQRLNEDLLGLWRERRFTCLFVTHSVLEAVYLSQKVLVLSSRPARVAAVHRVPFPHPRPSTLRTDPGFVALVQAVSADLSRTLGSAR